MTLDILCIVLGVINLAWYHVNQAWYSLPVGVFCMAVGVAGCCRQ